jgi:hypothetical protein
MMVTVVSNYCQLSQSQLSQTFAEKFTVTEELLQSLKKQRYPEMNKYQKSLNMPVWVDICSAGCYNRASFTLFLIISRVKR